MSPFKIGQRRAKQRAAYTSGHYQAIMKLVRQQKIDVVAGQFKKEFLDAVVDDVHTNNRIYLNDALTSRGKTVLAVFQITIAILDWQDLKMLKKFAIADALIAGCLADSRVDMANWEGVREVFGERTESFLRIRLSRFFPGDPFPNIPGWERTYEEIVKALESGQVGTFTPKRLNSWMTMHAKKEAKKEQNLFAKLATPFSR
jgi:hypothetical protein